MKKFLIVFSISLAMVACTGTKKDKNISEESEAIGLNSEFVTQSFKIDGLQDSVIYDSIWRIIFHVEGVDKLILTKDDSMAVFTFNPDSISAAELSAEITNRGGILVN